MSKIAIAIHVGAGKHSPFLKENLNEREAGLEEALKKGYQALKRGASALAAVEAAVIVLEDNPLFNAGRGSTLNSKGKVEMDAAIMDGKTLHAGAVSVIRRVKNPIVLARTVMEKTDHIYLSGEGALAFAKAQELILKSESYFISKNQRARFLKKTNQTSHGTVGAVALDKKGNIAAATSTGGTNLSLPGRVGDSCIIGAGCYANNKTCAVSSTGIGEYIISGVVAHSISMMMELKRFSLQKACDYVIHQRAEARKGKMGVIAIDNKGRMSFSYNTEVMPHGYIDVNGKVMITA